MIIIVAPMTATTIATTHKFKIKEVIDNDARNLSSKH